MLIKASLVVALAALCSGPLSAQTCSGGVGGGMDAQGCDCNDAALSSTDGAVTTVETAAIDANAAEGAWTHALDAYDRGHFADAMADLRVAALHGHPLAAEMLALMYRFGERLYGAQVHADAIEAAHFTTLAVSLRHHADDALAAEAPAVAP